MKKTITGVYSITNTVNGRIYVGSSLDITKRISAHKSALKRGDHHSVTLQRSFDKYGTDNFVFKTELICSGENRVMYEQVLMDYHNSTDSSLGFNMTKYAHAPSPSKFTDEMRSNMSKAQRAMAKKYNFNGEMLCLSEISEITKVPAKLLSSRVVDSGMSLEEAISKPMRVFSTSYMYLEDHTTPKALCEKYNKKLSVVISRLSKGWTIDRAMNTEAQDNKITEITYCGITLNTSQWAKKIQISQSLLRYRLEKLNWSVEKALTTPPCNRSLEFNGENLSLSEWARRLGCKPNTISARLDRGWTIDEALSIPARKTGRETK